MAVGLMTDEELFGRLIAFDTTSSRSTGPITDFLSDYLGAAGCEVQAYPYADGEKVNLVAWAGPQTDGGIILGGHLDVVPAAEPDWASDPFELTRRDDAYYARGSTDMKGAVALAVNAVARLRTDELVRPAALLLTSDEELGTLGAQAFVKSWDNRFPLPAEAVIGEPTELRVVRMHKGHLTVRLTITGRPAHSGCPRLGLSAIEPAADLVVVLRELRRTLEGERNEQSVFFSECPHPVLNVGMIRGGTAVNMVPDRCVLEIGVRLLPGQTTDAFLERFAAHLASAGDLPHERLGWEVVNDSAPMLCPEDSRLYRELSALVSQTESYGVSYASDAGPLQQLGIQSVLWGPGRIEDAHRANESVFVELFVRGGDLLGQFLRRRCTGAA